MINDAERANHIGFIGPTHSNGLRTYQRKCGLACPPNSSIFADNRVRRVPEEDLCRDTSASWNWTTPDIALSISSRRTRHDQQAARCAFVFELALRPNSPSM